MIYQWMPAYSLLTDMIDPVEDGLAGAASAFFSRNIFNTIDVRVQNGLFYSNLFGGLKADVAGFESLGDAGWMRHPARVERPSFTEWRFAFWEDGKEEGKRSVE